MSKVGSIYTAVSGGIGGDTSSVQRGTTTLSGAATTQAISAVTLGKATLNFSYSITGATTTIDSVPDNFMVRGKLTSTTQITFVRSGVLGTVTIDWEVVNRT